MKKKTVFNTLFSLLYLKSISYGVSVYGVQEPQKETMDKNLIISFSTTIVIVIIGIIAIIKRKSIIGMIGKKAKKSVKNNNIDFEELYGPPEMLNKSSDKKEE